MNNKRLSTLMLCFITILSSVILSGCASPEVKTSTTTTPQSIKDVTTTSEETKSVEILPDLPDKKFDGYEMVFCVRGDTFNEWESHDIYAEDENGDPINDALYNRNIFLEEKYNIKISQFGSANVAESAKKSITAGSNDYMAIMADTKETATILAAPGLLIDLKTIPYLDLSKDWWDQRSVNQLSIANKLYFMTGDMSIMANDATWIMMFNKPLAENYKFDNVYSDVLDGKWTFDRMYDMMAVVADDLNGDGKMTATDDQWGFATHASSIEGLFFASDSHTVAKDDNDLPYLDMNDERILGVIEKSNKIIADKNITMNANSFGITDMLKGLQPVFESGRALFYGEVMQCITRLRTMEIDFGVIPFPKYDDIQPEYNHFIHTTAAMLSIPMTNTELERTGILLEAMTAKSKYTLQKAYYEICLQGKFMRDNESEAMLDIITSTKNFDIGYIYGWGDLFGSFSTCVSKGTADFASSYDKNETKAITAMEKTVKAWKGEI